MAYRYQAIDATGNTVSDVVDAASSNEALEALRQRGLFVTHIESGKATKRKVRKAPSINIGGKPKLKDMVLITQQMAMLMRAGSRVVPALEAVETQANKQKLRTLLARVRAEVEQGKTLSESMEQFPDFFTPVYVNIISAGEASGDMAEAFDRVASLARQQNEVRSRIVGSLTYPAVLILLCVAVIIVLLTFILPRFKDMFEQLDVDLPFMTHAMIESSNFLMEQWIVVLIALGAVISGIITFFKSNRGKRLWSRTTVRLPLFGHIVRSVCLARICRIWGQLLDSKVPMLDAIRLTRESTGSLDFHELLQKMENEVTQGKTIASQLRESWLLPSTFAAAIATGEESGKISLSLNFVASCLEEANSQLLGSLSKIIEPLLLTMMGLIVGTMASSLFLPMFEMASAAK